MSEIYDRLTKKSERPRVSDSESGEATRSNESMLNSMRDKLSPQERMLQAQEVQEASRRYFNRSEERGKRRDSAVAIVEYFLSTTAVLIFAGIFFWARQISP